MQHVMIIHHKDCFDGVAAAWVAWLYYKSQSNNPMVTIHPAGYGDNPPDVLGCDVVIVDFSYPRTYLESMARAANSILVLDHHKTAQEALVGLPYAVFDMNRSGAGIAWDWFFPGKPRPWMIDCIQDRDLWLFKLPFTRRQMAFISTLPMTVRDYDNLVSMNEHEVASKGESIVQYIRNYGMKAIAHAFMKEIGGYAFWVINTSYMNCSDHLDLMMQVKEFDRAASFFLREDGKWQFSLRSRGDLDVSAIAKQYGGGGHKNAAGFEVSRLPWEK